MAELPSGTVTFLFTDIEGSTRLWQSASSAMEEAVARHDDLLRSAIETHGGVVFSTSGDGMAAAFQAASSAVKAALEAQRYLRDEAWPTETPIRVRMGLHTGEAQQRDGDYFGSTLNRTARLMEIGHGGEVLCSQATASLVEAEVPLIDLGEHRLRDLDRPLRVFQLGDGDFPPLRSLDAFPGNLPPQVSSFIGRRREIARVIDTLSDGRVVTLTGVGGVGKTRLALQVAAQILHRFREGAWLVELAPVRDPDGVVAAVAAVFGVVPRSGMTLEESLVDFLRTKQMLVVLDNCEHLLEAVADLAEVLERACAGLTILATSREGLALDGERVVPVPSLPGPSAGESVDAIAQSDAVRLFVERARAADPDFALIAATIPAVAQVCRRLDGVPLAIELAAARVVAMNPGELAQGLDRRFEALAGGRRRAVQRHQTLRAAIDWSYDLLSEPERRLLARLSVFAGGCTRRAVEAVCGGDPVESRQVFGLLTSLVSKSLVVAERDHPETRYRLLETIREYGEERVAEVGETGSLRSAHAEHYAEVVAVVSSELEGPHQVEAGKRLFADSENLIAAMNHAIDTGNVDLALRLLRDLPNPGIQVGYALWLPVEDALELPGAPDHPLYAYGLAMAAHRAATSGDFEIAERRNAEALVAANQGSREDASRIEASVEGCRAVIATALDVHDVAARHCERGAAKWQEVGRLGTAAHAFGSAAMEWALAGDTEAAVRLATEGLALARRVGTPSAIVFNLAPLAFTLADQDPERAHALLAESIQLRTSLEYENQTELVQAVLVCARLEDWPQALELAAAAIPRLYWMVNRPQLAGMLNVVARALTTDAAETAALLLGAARRLATVGGATTSTPPTPPPVEAQRSTDPSTGRPTGNVGFVTAIRRQATGLLIDRLGERRFRELRTEGEAMHEDRMVAYALDAIAKAQAGLPE